MGAVLLSQMALSESMLSHSVPSFMKTPHVLLYFMPIVSFVGGKSTVNQYPFFTPKTEPPSHVCWLHTPYELL